MTNPRAGATVSPPNNGVSGIHTSHVCHRDSVSWSRVTGGLGFGFVLSSQEVKHGSLKPKPQKAAPGGHDHCIAGTGSKS